jgi:hypothetical protein
MSVSCWWCGTSNKSADASCVHCGAPFNQKMQIASKPGFLGNYKVLMVEAVVLLICLITVYNKFEKFELDEYTPSYSNPVIRSSPSPTPSPTPKPKIKSSARRSQSIDKDYPLLSTEKAPFPDIPSDALSPDPRLAPVPRESRVNSSRNYILGPRGGCYYYSSSGRKVYVDHSFCQ